MWHIEDFVRMERLSYVWPEVSYPLNKLLEPQFVIWFARHGGAVLGATSVAAVPNRLVAEGHARRRTESEEPEMALLNENNPIEDGWITMQ